jgi:hypothetical protein
VCSVCELCADVLLPFSFLDHLRNVLPHLPLPTW